MDTLLALFTRLRSDILTMSTAAGSGHPTSSLSAVELMGVLFAKYFSYDPQHPEYTGNDRVIFSKGHASPLYYALYKAFGQITQEEMLTYRQFSSVLEGHPTRRFKFTEAATGSLGQGLAIGIGQALALRKLYQPQLGNTADLPTDDATEAMSDAHVITDSLPYVYVLMGDGELAEGSVWEAAHLASYYKIHNLVAVCDINRLGQSQQTSLAHNVDVYRRRFEAFGWGVIVIDGHSVSEIEAAYQKAKIYRAGPTAIIAKTIKGKGISFLEDKEGWHGKALSKEDLDKAIRELGVIDTSKIYAFQKPTTPNIPLPKNDEESSPVLKVYSEPMATRKSFGDAVAEYAQHHPRMMVIDGDVMNSTYTETFAKAYPERFIECFIAEQTMLGVATGLWCRGFIPWVSTFSAFLTRAFDQIRMASVTGATIHVNGSHAGVSIGADGESQMGLEDISLFRSVIDSTVVYPADAHASHALMLELMKREGVTYLRTTRDATAILYSSEENFPIGGSKVHGVQNGEDMNDCIVIISAGITLYEALEAQKEAQVQGKRVVVIDCYSIKPIDEQTITQYAQKAKQIIVVEDHYPEGGIGDAVQNVLVKHQIHVPFTHLAVREKPRSGTKQELMAYEKIDKAAILAIVI